MKARGYADVLIGLQFGDEGKARVIDVLAKNYDVVARFNGGSNAGHTIKNKKGSIALQQIPSGVFYPKIHLYIGSGCVVNIDKLVNEIEGVKKLGLKLEERFHISSQASIIQPHHIVVDTIMGQAVGTTKNGIGPSYSDKATRMFGDRLVNIRLADLIENPREYLKKIGENYKAVAREHNLKPEDLDTELEKIEKGLKIIASFVEKDPLYLQRMVEKGAKVLFEGAQSIMLDVTRGSVPFVTSSNTIAAAAYVGGDLSPNFHRKTIGIVKALMSRVGNGPFPSEFGGKKSEEYCIESKNGKPKYNKSIEEKYNVEKLIKSEDMFTLGKALRICSGEYGTVTKRPRRIGMMDLVQLSYAIKMNGVDELIITKCDILQFFSKTKKRKIPVVDAYTLESKNIDYVPVSPVVCYKVKPKVSYLEGFSENINEVRDFKNLPKVLKDFISLIERSAKTKVVGLGVGPQRDQFIAR